MNITKHPIEKKYHLSNCIFRGEHITDRYHLLSEAKEFIRNNQKECKNAEIKKIHAIYKTTPKKRKVKGNQAMVVFFGVVPG